MGRCNWAKRAYLVFLLCAAAAIALPAQTFTTLYSFCSQSGCTDGANPFAGLIQAMDGNLYGTTAYGEPNNFCTYGCGTIFRVTPTGTLTTLYNFCSQYGCTDGAVPHAGLIQATDGNFYGTTFEGGANGTGTVFVMPPGGGTVTTMHSFYGPDGSFPSAGLVQATDGNFYGTTGGGGVNDEGTVFRITPSGTLTMLYSFCSQSGCTDGAGPSGLVQATDGNFYGTTDGGGANNSCGGSGCGTVFKITPTGTLTTLYSFCSQSGCTDGENPGAGLVQATDGNFYGTTGGDEGTVFKITPSGTLTTLYNFCPQSGCTDGAGPSGLVQATDGNFYGTTDGGGAGNSGTVFKITPSGTLTTLYSFCSQSGCTDGDEPYAALVQASNGIFYGTTEGGGNFFGPCPGGCGTVFSLDAGLGPAVSLSPASLTFGPQGVQAPNVPQVVTLTNTGEMPLSITGIAVTGLNSGDFAQANNCPISPNTLAPGDSCMITVYFFPVGSGTLAAAVTITDNALGSPQNVPLSGVGVSGKPGLAGPRR